ncbi:histidine kinase, partial [Halorubrum sp. SS5]
EEMAEYEVSPTFPETDREATFSTQRYPYYDADGDLAGTFAICRNVTDRKERERELERYERAINGATDLIAAVDRDGRLL